MSQTFPAPVTLLADTVHFKEFYGGYTGTCGETALTAALICAEKLGSGNETHDAAVALMLSVTAEMRAAGWADANGASTLWSLAQEAAKKRGAQIALEWDYAEPFSHDWHSVLLANAGIKPIVLQVGQAYNLKGQDGTGNAEAGVHYHFICIVGKCADGYIVMDGDNWQIENELAIYSFATLQMVDICGLLMLDVVGSTPVTTSSQGSQMDSQFFTANSDGTYTCKANGFKLQHGILAWYQANAGIYRLGMPLGNEYVIPNMGTAVIQIFERGALVWDTARKYDNPPDVPAGDIYFAHINSGEVLKFIAGLAPAPVTSPDVTALQAQVSSLQGQLSTLHSALAGVRQVLDPISQADVQLSDAMTKAGF